MTTKPGYTLHLAKEHETIVGMRIFLNFTSINPYAPIFDLSINVCIILLITSLRSRPLRDIGTEKYAKAKIKLQRTYKMQIEHLFRLFCLVKTLPPTPVNHPGKSFHSLRYFSVPFYIRGLDTVSEEHRCIAPLRPIMSAARERGYLCRLPCLVS